MGMTDNYLITGPVTREIISTILDSLGNNTVTGGHSMFLGQVRADTDGIKKVIAIEYSAYETMVKAEADKIIKEINTAFTDVRIVRIIHSVGIVRAGEISLFVLVSAGHRRQAIDACSRIVELIKENLPVWKKEIFEDNTHNWKYNNLS
jgi:molybdopterin synthase catalytic subunit